MASLSPGVHVGHSRTDRPLVRSAGAGAVRPPLPWQAPAWAAGVVLARGCRTWSRRGRALRDLRASRTVRRFRSQWREVAGCRVYLPAGSKGLQPSCVVHFLGSGLLSSAPRWGYRQFLEAIAEETGAAVVASPWVGLDHETAAREAAEVMDEVLLALQRQGVRVAARPVWAIGVGTGAAVQLLLALNERRAGLVLLRMSTSELRLPKLPPALEKALPAALRGIHLPKEQLEQGSRAAEALLRALGFAARGNSQAAQALEAAAPGEIAQVLRQVLPVTRELLTGEEATPKQTDFAQKLKEGVGNLPKRMMLVEFNDPQDDSAWLLSTLGCEEQNPSEELEEAGLLEENWEEDEMEEEEEEDEEVQEARSQLEAQWEAESDNIQEWEDDDDRPRVVELLRVKCSSDSLLDFDASVDQGLSGAVGRFLRREPPPESANGAGRALAQAGAFALKAHLLRLTAGTNRGFGPVSFQRRGDILACIADLEVMAPFPGPSTTVPEQLFGRWRLIWSTSPAVLFLGSVPLLDCGEILQDITQRKELHVSSRARLAIPGSLPGAQLEAAWQAWAEVVSARRLVLHFKSSKVGPLQLPLPPSQNLSTTFLDDELRISREGTGEISVWIRV
ncbi:unnamed protein product [Effrenium voratum]|uniref:Plastid lipid-associated protein/fibrillin conserved domain-containing protein n=1 Tax=Effrenium voratum TaxID=2562239 RepID=A0AA36N4F0_9DINO|nr:unnamed protein product [Effrenium voratum]